MKLKKIFDGLFSKGKKEAVRVALPKFTLAKMRLASHPEAKSGSLKKLSMHNCKNIVARVAENSNTSIEVLEQLSRHVQAEVRIAVAENPKTPSGILMQLAADESVDVRYSLAENHNVPLVILTVLSNDENPYVVERARQTLSRVHYAKNLSTSWFPYFGRKDKQIGMG